MTVDAKVLEMLRELQHRYCIDILQDAASAAEHAGRRTQPGGGVALDVEDIRFASELKRRDGAEFAPRPAVAGLQRWAASVNRLDLPNVPKAVPPAAVTNLRAATLNPKPLTLNAPPTDKTDLSSRTPAESARLLLLYEPKTAGEPEAEVVAGRVRSACNHGPVRAQAPARGGGSQGFKHTRPGSDARVLRRRRRLRLRLRRRRRRRRRYAVFVTLVTVLLAWPASSWRSRGRCPLITRAASLSS